ncbi:hypothetical protein PI93_022135 [Pandoraea fibrosis]|uniref:Integrase n=1 Tax=Pandoraea fibrosis TaxID=1891094 RepID=A0ABX6HWW5_9BURK|nr:hypothetical protein [Pandoraea fibrosis]QHE91395.1 hypothetical protein PJ20_005865 [Pandoraea fibrosis]QHF15047.1 hypothetical protein PI93_022135 [Pandoraea fibrosis]
MTFFTRIPVSSQLVSLSETVAARCSQSARNDQGRVTMGSFRHLFKAIKNLNMRSFSASDNTPETQFRYAYICSSLHDLRATHLHHPQKLKKVEKVQQAFNEAMCGHPAKRPAKRAGAPVTHYLRGLREEARINFAAEFDGVCRAERVRQPGRALSGASRLQSS